MDRPVTYGMFVFPFGPKRRTAIFAALDLACARKIHPEARPITARELCAAFVSQVRVEKFDSHGDRIGYAEPSDFAPEFATKRGF